MWITSTITHFLLFVIGLNIIAWIHLLPLGNIVQTKMKVVKVKNTVKNPISSVIIAEPAYQKVNSLLLIILRKYE